MWVIALGAVQKNEKKYILVDLIHRKKRENHTNTNMHSQIEWIQDIYTQTRNLIPFEIII